MKPRLPVAPAAATHQRTGLHGKQIENRQGASHAEVQFAPRAALQDLRSAAGGVSEIRNLPDLFP